MVHMFKYMAHPGQEQENQIIWKTSDVINLLQIGWGFQYIEKGDFRSGSMTFSEFMRTRTHISVLSLNTTRFAE